MRAAYLLESPLRRPGLVWAPALLLALAATALAWQLPPRFRAAALVGVEWAAGNDAPTGAQRPDGSSRLPDVVRRVRDPALLRRVASEAPGLAAERLAAGLEVRPLASGSYWVEFVHHDPRTAALVPNAIGRLLHESREQGDARFELLREAPVPDVSESPTLPRAALVGALLGLVLGLALAAVAELRDHTVKGPEDLAGILPVPVLATLPELRGLHPDRDREPRP